MELFSELAATLTRYWQTYNEQLSRISNYEQSLLRSARGPITPTRLQRELAHMRQSANYVTPEALAAYDIGVAGVKPVENWIELVARLDPESLADMAPWRLWLNGVKLGDSRCGGRRDPLTSMGIDFRRGYINTLLPRATKAVGQYRHAAVPANVVYEFRAIYNTPLLVLPKS